MVGLDYFRPKVKSGALVNGLLPIRLNGIREPLSSWTNIIQLLPMNGSEIGFFSDAAINNFSPTISRRAGG